MDRNKVSHWSSVRIVLRPLHISKANLFWPPIKITLHYVAATSHSENFASSKAGLNPQDIKPALGQMWKKKKRVLQPCVKICLITFFTKISS